MPRGDKSSYTSKQKRKAEHIEEGYEKKGVSSGEAARRAWATVNKQEGGGKKKKAGGSKSKSSGSKSGSSAKKSSSSKTKSKTGGSKRKSGGSKRKSGPQVRRAQVQVVDEQRPRPAWPGEVFVRESDARQRPCVRPPLPRIEALPGLRGVAYALGLGLRALVPRLGFVLARALLGRR
jgi:hypothetical protein